MPRWCCVQHVSVSAQSVHKPRSILKFTRASAELTACAYFQVCACAYSATEENICYETAHVNKGLNRLSFRQIKFIRLPASVLSKSMRFICKFSKPNTLFSPAHMKMILSNGTANQRRFTRACAFVQSCWRFCWSRI